MMKMMPCAMKYIDFINLVMKRRWLVKKYFQSFEVKIKSLTIYFLH